VSTVPNFDDNLALMKRIRAKRKGVSFFVTTNRIDEALKLYEAGADYVIVPRFLGGDKASILLQEFMEKDFRDLHRQRQLNIEEMKEYRKLGQVYV